MIRRGSGGKDASGSASSTNSGAAAPSGTAATPSTAATKDETEPEHEEVHDSHAPLLGDAGTAVDAALGTGAAAKPTGSLNTTAAPSASSAKAANKSVLWDQFWYLITGVLTTLLGQQLSYMGAANKYSLIPVALVYLGMASVWLLPADPPSAVEAAAASASKPNNKLALLLSKLDPRLTLLIVALGDCIGQAICFIAMVMAGSGVFQVIYSSILIFVAFQSRLLLGKPISRGAWLWIGVVSLGLLIAGVAPILAATSSSAAGAASTAPSLAAIGMCVAGVVTYSFQYIVYECALHLPSLRVTPKQLCVQVGLYGSALTLAYITLYTVPNYNALLLEPMQAAAANTGAASAALDTRTVGVVVGLYVLILVCHCVHNVTYFNLVGSSTGAMGAGIVQALRAVGVFGLSSALFCSVQASQCFDLWKGASTLVVVIGVLGYTKYK